MSRYKVSSDWSPALQSREFYAPFLIEEAHIVDTRTGQEFVCGARRVVDTRTGKPAKTGKGGTVPFFGESAWSDAERLASDLALKVRYA